MVFQGVRSAAMAMVQMIFWPFSFRRWQPQTIGVFSSYQTREAAAKRFVERCAPGAFAATCI